jgi:AcrR family transcriptional regulator
MSTTPAPSRAHRRADHVRNRATLLHAAREVFAEQGADAPVEAIAHRAGFAKATFFRHFPNKEGLVQALLADRLVALGEIAREINTTREPGWTTLGSLMERLLDQIADDRSLAEFLERGERVRPTEEILRAREVLAGEIDRAVAGAQERGEVRPDVSGLDFPPIVFMITRATARHHGTHPWLGRRYLRLFLDGIRAGHDSDLGGPPLTFDDLRRARSCPPARPTSSP